jgi:hypothetical protein
VSKSVMSMAVNRVGKLTGHWARNCYEIYRMGLASHQFMALNVTSGNIEQHSYGKDALDKI